MLNSFIPPALPFASACVSQPRHGLCQSRAQAIRDLASIRKAPLEFDADFETRLEQTIYDLQEQVSELREMLRKEQQETRMQVMKNLAKLQGQMMHTVRG